MFLAEADLVADFARLGSVQLLHVVTVAAGRYLVYEHQNPAPAAGLQPGKAKQMRLLMTAELR